MEYINCNLCNSNEYNLFKEINKQRFVKCKQCGLVYLNPRPAEEDRDRQYTAEYYIDRILVREPKTKEEIEKEINKNTARAKEIIKKFGKKGKLLDVGCGAGFFMACLKRYGWEVAGVDISEWASKFAKERLGLKVFTGNIEEIQFEQQFDVITMYHILEHFPDPVKSLKRVSELITNDGILIVKGPNLAGFDRIWHGKNWSGYADRTHLYYFTPKTYKIILEKADFSLRQMNFQFWNPISHLIRIWSKNDSRTDYSPELIKRLEEKREDSFLWRIINKTAGIASRLFYLSGQNLTIYAGKNEVNIR